MTYQAGDRVIVRSATRLHTITALDGPLATLEDATTVNVAHLTLASRGRSLTAWEEAVCAALAPLGFRYFPHDGGSGYWLNNEHGLYLTNDLDFHARGATRCWHLKLVEGLVIGDIRFDDRKRKSEAIAADVAGKIRRLLSNPEWRSMKEWGKKSL